MKSQTHTQFAKFIRPLSSITGAILLMLQTASAGNVIKADNSDNLDQSTSWVGGVPPTSSDVAVWNNTIISGANTVSLGTDTNWLGVAIQDPAGAVTINAGNTLTLGASGIDMAAATQDLTLGGQVGLAANQTWNVGAGRALVVSGAITGAPPAGLVKSGAGILALNGPNTYTNGTTINGGIIRIDTTVGTFGFNVATNPVTLNGGTISNNVGVNNTFSMNNNLVIPSGQTGTVYMGNRFVLNNSAGQFILGSGTLNLNGTSTVARDDIKGNYNTPPNQFTGTVNYLGNGQFRHIINTGSFVGWSNATVNVNGPASLQFHCNSTGNTFEFGALSGNNSAAAMGLTTAGSLPRFRVGWLNTSTTFAGQFVGSASLIKVGTGTLTLTANSTHTGTNFVSAGKLVGVTGGSMSNSVTINVASGATFGVFVSPAGPRWVAPSLTNQANSTLDINFGGATPSTTTAPLLVRGNVSLAATVTNTIVGGNWAVGQYPLIKYTGSLVGSGFAALTLASQPARVQGYLSNNVANLSIDYVVTNTTEPLRWATGDGVWDINATANWKDNAGAATTYQETNGFGDAVLFEDSQSGSSPVTVTLNSTIAPINVAHNGTKNFTITGTGNISGSGSVTKGGAGVLTMATTNAFTGGTVLNAGTLSFSTLANLGDASSPITFAGGTLQYGPANSSDVSAGRTVTLSAGGGTIDVGTNNVAFASPIGNGGAGGLTKLGNGILSLSGTNNYSGVTLVQKGTLSLASGAMIANSTAIVVTNGAILDASASGVNLSSSANQVLAGNGLVNALVTNNPSTTISPGTNGTIATLTINSNLTFNGGTYACDVATTGHDLISVNGNLTINSGTTLAISAGALTNGSYTVIQYSGSLSGTAANMLLTGFSQPGKLAQLSDATPGQINLIVDSVANDALTWSGTANSWDLSGTADWLNGANPWAYTNGDAVTFDNTGAGNPNVVLATILQPGSVTVNSSSDYTFSGSGIISGNTKITKSGAGMLTISTLDNNTGGMLINGGTVRVGDGGTAGDLGIGNVTNNAALVFQQPDNRIVNAAVSGSGTLTQNGFAVLTLAKDNSYSGATTIGAGAALQVGNGGSTGTLGTNGTSNSGVLLFNRTGTFNYGGDITGPGIVSKDGASTLTLSGNNSYTGGTTNVAGTLKLGSASAIPTASILTMVGGTLDVNGHNLTLNELIGTGGTILNNATSTNTVDVGADNVATTYAGVLADNSGIGGKIALYKEGAGAFILSGVNSYSGGTIVAAGELDLNVNSAAAGAGGIILSNGVTLNVPSTGGSVFPGNDITVGADANATLTGAGGVGNNGLGGNFIAANTNSVLSVNGGMSIAGANVKQFQSFTGLVQITSLGTIRFSSTGLSLNGGDNTLFDIQGTLTCRNGMANGSPGISLGAISGAGTIGGGGNVGGANFDLYVIGSKGTDSTFSGTISDGSASTVRITKVGPGRLTLDGTIGYTGATTVSNGVLAVGSVNNPSASIDSSSSILLANNAIIDVSGRSDDTLSLGNSVAQTLDGQGTIRGSVLMNSPFPPTLAAGAGGIGRLTITNALTVSAGTIALEINRTNAFTNDEIIVQAGPITINGGSLVVTNLGPDLVTGDVYHLFNGPVTGTGFASIVLPSTNAANTITYQYQTNLTVDGTITVLLGASAIATNPTNITMTVSGNSMQLTWPGDHLGWTLQTNASNLADTNAWFPFPGSTSTTNVSIPMDRTKTNVFFRLKY